MRPAWAVLGVVAVIWLVALVAFARHVSGALRRRRWSSQIRKRLRHPERVSIRRAS